MTESASARSAESRRRLPPPGWEEARIAMADGWTVRIGRSGPAQSRHPALLLIGGRGDFIEKNWETMADLADRGIICLSFDWRGQGKSGRLADGHHKCHADSFDVLLADAVTLLDGQWAGLGPLLLAGHSMGGHMAARLLLARPGRFRRAVLLSPMLGINSGPLPQPLIRRLARLMVRRGRARRYAFGQGPYGPAMRSAVRRDRLTSDDARFSDEDWFMQQQPELVLGGVTFGWVNAAFESIAALGAPGVPESLAMPILILAAEREQLVDNRATAAFAARQPNGALEIIAGARHELLREADAIRSPALARMLGFLELL